MCIDHLIRQLKVDNEVLQTEVKNLKTKLEERECELMIQNEKLRLENHDLIQNKYKNTKAKDEFQEKYNLTKKDLTRCQDENKKLKMSLEHSEKEKKFQISELDNDIHKLKSQLQEVKAENEKLRSYNKERFQSYAKREYPNTKKNYDEFSEQQKKRVEDLLNYRAHGSDKNLSKPRNPGDTPYQRQGSTEGEENNFPIETPSRSIYNPSSEEAFMRSSQRRFVNKNYQAEKNSDDGSKSKSSNDKDRSVYSGFKENDSEKNVKDYSEYQHKLMQSIERRVGGKFMFIICNRLRTSIL